MALTVAQLISRLKKFDQGAKVVWRNHDQSENECDGYVGAVSEAEPELLEVEKTDRLVVLSAL